MSDLSGKTAIVTGAGSGVGRDVAVALAAAGANVGLVGRTSAPLLDTVAIIAESAGSALALPADVADEIQVQAAVDAVVKTWAGVDILVCAAGVGLYGPVESYSLADWRTTLETNLTGVFLSSRAVVPLMRHRGGGNVIAIGSGAGKQGYANLAAYSASKFGLIGFMQSLAAEVGEFGIKVSTILPGSIMTGFGGKAIAEKEQLQREGRSYLSAGDVADAVMFLLRQPPHAWTQELNLWPR